MNIHAWLSAIDGEIFARLGEPVTHSGATLMGIYTSPWLGPDLGITRTGLTEPRLTLRAADATGIARGTLLTVRGAEHTVVDVQPDGDHLVALVLRRAS